MHIQSSYREIILNDYKLEIHEFKYPKQKTYIKIFKGEEEVAASETQTNNYVFVLFEMLIKILENGNNKHNEEPRPEED